MNALQQRKDWPIIGSVALGALAGFLAVKMMSKEDKQKINGWVNDQMAKLEDFLSDEEFRARISSIYESTDAKARAMFSKMYQSFLTKVYDLRDSAKKIDKNKYRRVVDDFTEQLKADGSFTEKQLGRLKDYLTQDYKMLTGKA